VDQDCTDQRIVFEHWHTDSGSRFAECGCSPPNSFGSIVISATHLLCADHAIVECAGSWCKRSTLPLKFHKFRRCPDFRCELEVLTIYAKKNAELSFADAYRVFQHTLKHRFQIAWRRADHAQHVRCGRLLFQRLP